MITMMLSTAFALDCGPSDACTDANAIRDGLNSLAGPNTISDSHNKAKRRTVKIFNRISAIYDAADAGGCTIDGIDYVTTSNGTFSGFYEGDGDGTLSGTFSNGQVTGSYDGDESGDIGDWGRYVFKAGKWGALRGDGFVMGGLVRLSGSSAVAYGVHGTCGQDTDIAAVFSGYLPQLSQYELEETLPPADPFPGDYVLLVSTCDAFALPEEGVLTVLDDEGSGYGLEVDGEAVVDSLGQPVAVTQTGPDTYAYSDGLADTVAIYTEGLIEVFITVPVFNINCFAFGVQL